MPVSASIDAVPTAPDHGQTLTAAYSVSGNDGTPAQSATLTGRVVVAGVGHDVSTTITLPAVAADEVIFETPTCDGLTFTGTGDPAVFTAVVP